MGVKYELGGKTADKIYSMIGKQVKFLVQQKLNKKSGKSFSEIVKDSVKPK